MFPLCVASVFGMWAESRRPFLEVDSACSELVAVREKCLRELTGVGGMLPEAFVAGWRGTPAPCALCPGSQRGQEPPAWPGCEPPLCVWAFPRAAALGL